MTVAKRGRPKGSKNKKKDILIQAPIIKAGISSKPIKTKDRRGNIGYFIQRFENSWKVTWE